MTNDSPNNLEESQHAWRVSLAFWLCLLLAALLYASVALAPKLLAYTTLDAEYAQKRRELVSLQRRVAHLERVRDALENDPEFAAELARAEFHTLRPGDERIAVEPLLSLNALPAASGSLPAASSGSLPWYRPVLVVLAEHRGVRMSLLATAAVVILGAFTFLQEPAPAAAREAATRRAGPWSRIAARYRKH